MTPSQRALLVKARRSLRSASLLLDHGETDFAAARAYYTMFYVAEALLLDEGLSFSSHAAVQGAFGQRLAKTGKVPAEFHRYLLRGFEVRQTGDYLTTPVSEEDAAEQIARAEKFLRLAAEVLGPFENDETAAE